MPQGRPEERNTWLRASWLIPAVLVLCLLWMVACKATAPVHQRDDPFSAEGGSGLIRVSAGGHKADGRTSPQPTSEAEASDEECAPVSMQQTVESSGDAGPQLPVYEQVALLCEKGDFESAESALEESREEFGKDRLLYLMETALMNLYAGRDDTAVKLFTEADRLDQELYTQSLTVQASTFIINDLTAPYRGEDFESVLLNLFLSLGYARRGMMEDALVEARKVDSKLASINNQYPADEKNVYKEDAFVRWLMGMMYEAEPGSANLNDAYVSYRKAVELYEEDYRTNYGVGTPSLLKEDYLRLARWMGGDDWKSARKSIGDLPFKTLEDRGKLATLVFIHFNGKSPVKVESSITSPLPDGHIVKLAFPMYQERPFRVVVSEITAVGVDQKAVHKTRSRLGEPVGEIALKNLENRKGRIVAKAIVRAAAKYAATKAIQDQVSQRWGEGWGRVVGVVGSIASVLSERADLRFWGTLPHQIRVAKLYVPPGEYVLGADSLDLKERSVVKVDLGIVRVQAGETKFFTFGTTL